MNNTIISFFLRARLSALFILLVSVNAQPVGATENTPINQTPTSCAHILSSETGNNEILELKKSVEQKISARTQKLNSNPPLLVRDDGEDPTDLRVAIERLVYKEIISLLSQYFRNQLEAPIKNMGKIYEANLIAEQTKAKNVRTSAMNQSGAQNTSVNYTQVDYTQKDNDGWYLHSAFIQTHKERLAQAIANKKATRPDDPKDNVDKQERWAAEYLKKKQTSSSER